MKELDYLENLALFGIKLGLANTKKFDKLLGFPHKKYKTIHIAGTNGKGSTALYIANILEKAGYKVGLYTSPHLVRFNERIKVNGKEISDNKLKNKIKKLRKIVEKNKLDTTFFEFTTFLALDYFKEKKVDYAVIEVGLGGRFDATNIINPRICAITNIGKDHMKHLGYTYSKIAFEKAGIIKKSKLVITTENKKSCLTVFRKIAKEKKAKLIRIKKFEKINLKMLGRHQQKNANLAKQLIKSLNLKINDKIINSALYNTQVEGRYQTISEKPKIIIDSSHNPEGIKTLEKLIKKEKNKKILLVGLSEDKPVSMIKNLCKSFDEVVVSKSNFKPKEIEEIILEVAKWNKKVIGFEKIKNAKKYALSKLNKNDTMLITGSIYFSGNYLALK